MHTILRDGRNSTCQSAFHRVCMEHTYTVTMCGCGYGWVGRCDGSIIYQELTDFPSYLISFLLPYYCSFLLCKSTHEHNNLCAHLPCMYPSTLIPSLLLQTYVAPPVCFNQTHCIITFSLPPSVHFLRPFLLPFLPPALLRGV